MNHLPKLSMGVRRTAGVARTILGRGTSVAQAQSISPPIFLNRPSDDVGPIGPMLLSGSSAALGLEFPIYGKYCGPGHTDPSYCSPDDQVDAACCQHDLCYDQQGYFSCGCDCDLVRSMPSAIANTSSAEGKIAGAALGALAATAPCVALYKEIGSHKVPIIVYPGGPEKCLLF